jgi:hypothetical protein
MKKQKVVVITEQELSNIVKGVLSALGVNTDDILDRVLGRKKDKKVDTKITGNFEKVTNQIIDQLEGGYYHPDMLKDGRVRDSRYGNSGETMFGIDRKAGGSLENDSPAGREFWRLIDAENARKNWKHEYMLKDKPELAKKLKRLVAQIMEPLFIKNQKNYLSPKAKEIINSDPRLYYNFAYATWNGPGWFQRFANGFNKEVEKGKTKDELVDFVVSQRKNWPNSLIAQSGRKMEKILDAMA